ncbi:MAG: DNA polymerase III subunit delta [Pirellulaceae bacterium]|nr:MAG: DNA polymerase III subunit delta [Pirellulaceae bacterium]
MPSRNKSNAGAESTSSADVQGREQRVIHALDFLENSGAYLPAAATLLMGNEPYLRRMVLDELIAQRAPDEGSYEVLQGPDLEWRDFSSHLETRSLFSPDRARLVVVDEAEAFVSDNRQKLEKYLANPSPATELVLIAHSINTDTKVYKLLATRHRVIRCTAPPGWGGRGVDTGRVLQWLMSRAARVHRVTLDPKAGQVMLDRVGVDFGVLDQELARLAVLRLPETHLSVEFVDEHVGNWRMRTGWEMIDAMLRGDAATALQMLHRLLDSGEGDVSLVFGQLSWALRQYAAATRIVQRAERAGQRPQLPAALAAAGVRDVPRGNVQRAVTNLRQIGRRRASQLYRWLLEIDLALKGTHSQPDRARFALEQLILKLSRPTAPAPSRTE